MRSVEARVADWIDVVADLLMAGRPAAESTTLICEQLLDTFESGVVTVSVRDENGRLTQGGAVRDTGSFGGKPFHEALASLQPVLEGGFLNHHPAVAWHAATGSSAPQVLSRVPAMFRSTPEAQHVMDVLRCLEVAEQLDISAVVSGLRHTAFVLHRPAAGDYSGEDLSVARRIQPLFVALHRQLSVIDPVVASSLGTAELTGRELAVLSCIARGMTAGATAAELMISPRTAEKHAEHAYRKLGVRDRVSAVRAAREAGILL